MNFCRADCCGCEPTHCCGTEGRATGVRQHLGFLIVSAIILTAAWLLGAKEIPNAHNDGEALYLSRCMSCHQVDGNGIAGVFPPVNGTEWVTGDKGRLIRIVLGGVMGPMKVGNVTYGGAMPPWQGFLDDEEVAALLTYMRSAWDNDASAVTAEEVRLVRTATADRTAPWAAEELMLEANQGIPGAFGSLAAPQDTTNQ